MAQKINYEKIFTPQGFLGDVSKNPNLDFLMNIFNIPRIYSVSGFGSWNVGQHTLATAFLALYWAKFNSYKNDKRDRLVTLALLHDTHEAVVGDILPYFKTDDVRAAVEEIQGNINKAFDVVEDLNLRKDLKLIDMISFLYEISQSSPKGINPFKQNLLKQMFENQKKAIIEFADKEKIDKKNILRFLKKIEL